MPNRLPTSSFIPLPRLANLRLQKPVIIKKANNNFNSLECTKRDEYTLSRSKDVVEVWLRCEPPGRLAREDEEEESELDSGEVDKKLDR